MIKLRYAILIFLFSFSGIYSQNIRHVPEEFSSIQSAVDASLDNDTIMLEPGAYYENINMSGKKICIASHFIDNSNPLLINKTIIDGKGTGSVITCNTGEDTNTVIKGVTIQNGGNGVNGGGGISLSASGIRIQNCVIRNNSSTNFGGALFSDSPAAVIINNCDIYQNNSRNGGGIAVKRGALIVTETRIHDNSADNGAAFYISSSEAIIENSLVYGNNSVIYGGAVYAEDSSGYKLSGSVFYRNSALEGGALYNTLNVFPAVINSDIVYNTSSTYGGGICNKEINGSCVLFNSILYFNSGASANQIHSSDSSNLVFANCNISNSENDIIVIDKSNINIIGKLTYYNPQFKNGENNDFTLTSNSFCLGSGAGKLNFEGKEYFAPQKDLFKTDRPSPANSNPDIGAVESSLTYPDVFIRIDTVYSANNDTAIVPVMIKNFKDIERISLTINFDTAKTQFDKLINITKNYTPLLINVEGGKLRLTFEHLNGYNAETDKLFEMKFITKDLFFPSPVTFDNSECTITDIDGYSPGIDFSDGLIFKGNNLKGTISYYNSFASPVKNAVVTITRLSDHSQRVTLTDSLGNYAFYGIAPEKFIIKANKSGETGGINATDALLTLRYFTGDNPFDKLQRCAADVNNSYSINATDALIILYKYIDTSTSYLNNKPDWVFKEASTASVFKDDFDQEDTLLIWTGNVTYNLKALCSGDVNKSYTYKGTQKPVLWQTEAKIAVEGKSILCPVFAESGFDCGSISLEISFPAKNISFSGIENAEKFPGLIYKEKNGIVKIAWADFSEKGKGVKLYKDEELFRLKFTTADNFQSKYIAMQGKYEAANNSGEVFTSDLLRLRNSVIQTPSDFILSQNYPNPFNPSTQIKYSVPADCFVHIKIYNSLGQKIAEPLNELKPAGNYILNFNASAYASGVYFYKLDAKPVNGTSGFSRILKMVLMK